MCWDYETRVLYLGHCVAFWLTLIKNSGCLSSLMTPFAVCVVYAGVYACCHVHNVLVIVFRYLSRLGYPRDTCSLTCITKAAWVNLVSSVFELISHTHIHTLTRTLEIIAWTDFACQLIHSDANGMYGITTRQTGWQGTLWFYSSSANPCRCHLEYIHRKQ